MREKTIKTLNINGNKIEIYQFRILLNGKNCSFLAYSINGEDRKGYFLINEIEMLTEYVRTRY